MTAPEPSPFCSMHPEGSTQGCGPCRDARMRREGWLAAQPEMHVTQVNHFETLGIDEIVEATAAMLRGAIVPRPKPSPLGELLIGRVGDDHRVDLPRVLALIDDGFMFSSAARTLTARLRSLADEIDAQVRALDGGA